MEILILIIGLCIGSFLNVCIYRIPREESIAFPPSHCTSCGYELKAVDLIPVISYLFLKRKCRKCGEKISINYPLVELLNGVLYLLIFLRFGLSLSFVFYSLLTSLLIVISYIDLDSKYIYSSTTILGVVLAAIYIVVGLYTKDISISNNVLGGAIGYGIIYLIVVITKGMGQGDAEVAGVCGLFIGIKGILVCLFIAVVLGGLVAAIILIFKLKEKKSEIAFSPYISIGSIVYILLGKEILSLYLNFFI
ncbi:MULTISPECIES: A24 family peptidase [Clostridium]|jgi:leader peptidase (prepilin peptidase)/N-methyltransferase|uniref:Prepilin peptidase n=3 Tax=Clostridium tertium TaxID=1559 RepID=A0A9X3XSM1_9CLOT|nr:MULTISPECIES: A24 family peptidase [Clostridium]MBU6134113.1 prepilin peptidase [Clostridium tertium]MDB1933925.1 prepilin peptidase [Clostridium tertium]MDB1936558.1 prepilin peptidase [Clostridium tertium]MDB1939356.1 prepilin peptidase [Clostridium tertium]MDB1946427.1 prepilin peptidase [Clostridium tertium]